MLEWLLPALAVAQLAARKTLVSACACSVSLFTTTCALCVARLQTRRRWLFVSPSPSLIVHCEPYNSYTTVCATSLSPCDTHRTCRSSANNRAPRTHIHCATVQYEVNPTTAPLLLFISPPKVTPPGESTSVVGSSTPNTACSKVCKSCPTRANSNTLGKFHRAQQSLGSVARCQKTANLSLPRLTR